MSRKDQLLRILASLDGKHHQVGTRDHRRQTIARPGARNVKQYIEAGRPQGETVMRYAVVIEKADGNFSAYVPDLPGCVATGDTREEAERKIPEAVRFHIEGLKADGLPTPEPQATMAYIET
jgi:predicted RNase H-like HicB family nuclease